jgi:zinc ribbon protein
MRGIKRGRGPSAMGAFGSAMAVMFGIGWTVFAYSLTRDSPFPMVGILFPLFGVLFVVVGIVQAYYHFTNATGENRFSEFDITDEDEESDPLNQAFGRAYGQRTAKPAGGREIKGAFCPYCGAKAQPEFDYCPKCGKDI